jgi:hypothetical protein
MVKWVRREWAVLWNGSRWPHRQKTAWINIGLWIFALAWVALSVIADFITGRFAFLPLVLAVGAFDVVMLHRCVQGLLWRRELDRFLEVMESK